MNTENCYADEKRAESYAELEFPGTYYLAYRDLPELLLRHVTGRKALDFGCGTGRSTRFLKEIGFAATGVDIAAEMISQARKKDPEGIYRLIGERDTGPIEPGAFDLALAVFTFDNIPTEEAKVGALRRLRESVHPQGRVVLLVSTPEIYTHQWASFSTEQFPENRKAKSGDRVRIIMTDVADGRPVEDTLFSEEAYRECFREAGLSSLATHKPLGREEEPHPWISETTIPPWAIHVLKPE